MSTDAAVRFLARISADDALASALQATVTGHPSATEAMAAFAVEHGHDVSGDELAAALDSARGELSDEDLDGVAGGLGPQPEPPDRTRLRTLSRSLPAWILQTR